MIYGLEVLDAKGVQTLGMEDFTIQRLATLTIPASRSGGLGIRGDYILINVDGYDPATCFVTITPKAYSPYPQGAGQAYWGCVPTYKDLGGTQIGIITYGNYFEVDYKGDWIFKWKSEVVESVVEVVRVI